MEINKYAQKYNLLSSTYLTKGIFAIGLVQILGIYIVL